MVIDLDYLFYLFVNCEVQGVLKYHYVVPTLGNRKPYYLKSRMEDCCNKVVE